MVRFGGKDSPFWIWIWIFFLNCHEFDICTAGCKVFCKFPRSFVSWNSVTEGVQEKIMKSIDMNYNLWYFCCLSIWFSPGRMSIRSGSVTSSPIPKRKRSRIQDLCAAWSISKSVSNGFGAHWVVLRVAEEVCNTYRAGRRLMKLDIFFATRSEVLKPFERI